MLCRIDGNRNGRRGLQPYMLMHCILACFHAPESTMSVPVDHTDRTAVAGTTAALRELWRALRMLINGTPYAGPLLAYLRLNGVYLLLPAKRPRFL